MGEGVVQCPKSPTNSFLLLGVLASGANFGENRSRNATMRVHTDGYTDSPTLTDANRFYNLPPHEGVHPEGEKYRA